MSWNYNSTFFQEWLIFRWAAWSDCSRPMVVVVKRGACNSVEPFNVFLWGATFLRSSHILVRHCFQDIPNILATHIGQANGLTEPLRRNCVSMLSNSSNKYYAGSQKKGKCKIPSTCLLEAWTLAPLMLDTNAYWQSVNKESWHADNAAWYRRVFWLHRGVLV